MKTMFWLAIGVSVAVIAFLIRYVMRRITERERAADARAAELLAQVAGAKLPVPATAKAPPAASTLETQKLLFDAARKAADAGEPALAVQLYERLLARFPDSAFASQARVAAEEQKKKLVKA